MTKFHILTLFPEMILQGLSPSIIGRAAGRGLLSLNAVDIRDYTLDRHGKVDDYPYGGGAGMLMQAQPVYDAHRAVTGGRAVRTIYMTPQGAPFTQRMAQDFAREEELVFLCGHYEGIDERVLELVVTDQVSIGDYVLTGGELAAMVMIDAIGRLIPGVLGNEESAGEESFYNDLLEYPQYSRPEQWQGMRVPEVLLSGNHRLVSAWRLEQSRQRTARRRPDLYARYQEGGPAPRGCPDAPGVGGFYAGSAGGEGICRLRRIWSGAVHPEGGPARAAQGDQAALHGGFPVCIRMVRQRYGGPGHGGRIRQGADPGGRHVRGVPGGQAGGLRGHP